MGGVELARDLLENRLALRGIGFLMSQVEVSFQVAREPLKFFVSGDGAFCGFALLQDLLRLFRILPEVGLRSLLF